MTLRTGVTAIAMLLTSAAAQSPAFEVASVRTARLPPGSFAFENPYTAAAPAIAGNRVTASGTLHSLVRSAYNVKGNQVLGAPDWATLPRGDVYNVEAKVEGDGTPGLDQVRSMLQALLAERFELKLHRDKKDLRVYKLVIAKNGPKLTESAPDATPSGRFTTGGVDSIGGGQ